MWCSTTWTFLEECIVSACRSKIFFINYTFNILLISRCQNPSTICCNVSDIIVKSHTLHIEIMLITSSISSININWTIYFKSIFSSSPSIFINFFTSNISSTITIGTICCRTFILYSSCWNNINFILLNYNLTALNG